MESELKLIHDPLVNIEFPKFELLQKALLILFDST